MHTFEWVQLVGFWLVIVVVVGVLATVGIWTLLVVPAPLSYFPQSGWRPQRSRPSR